MTDTPTSSLGKRLRDARIGRGMTQDQLASNEFSKSYVSAVELGKIKPSVDALRILAERLSYPISHFLDKESEAIQEQLEFNTLRTQYLYYQGEYEAALATLEENQLLIGSDKYFYHLLRGRILIKLAKSTEAIQTLEKALTMTSDIEKIEEARYTLGLAYAAQHKTAMAADCHRQCLEAIQQNLIREPQLVLRIYHALSNEYFALGKYREAIAFYEQAEEISRKIEDKREMAKILWELGERRQREMNAERAQRYFQESLALSATLEDATLIIEMQNIYGTIFTESKEHERARECYKAALEASKIAHDEVRSALSCDSLANLNLGQSQFEEALRMADEAWGYLEGSSNDDLAAGKIFLTYGLIYEALKDHKQADDYFERAIAHLIQAHKNDLLSKAYFNYGQALVGRGNTAKGAEFLQQAYLEARKSGL